MYLEGRQKLGLALCEVKRCFTSQCRQDTLWLVGSSSEDRGWWSNWEKLTRPVVPDLGE